jgi:hypothetical protein
VRLYLNYFKWVHQVGLLKRIFARLVAQIVSEPAIERLTRLDKPIIYEFHQVPHWADMFRDLKPYRDEIRTALLAMLSQSRLREYAASPNPKVCIQVRLGDFRVLKATEDFAKVGGVRTPIEYFINMTERIREVYGSKCPVTIVTDGSRNQVLPLLSLGNVELGPPNSKIVDILMMAKSNVLVPSAGSTFGYWAGFLGNCAIIMHPDHIHQPIRPDSANRQYYEGPAVGPTQDWPELLRNNIRAISNGIV